MLSSPIRYCGIMIYRNHSALPINKNNMVQAVAGFGFRNYAKNDKDCCKDVVQSEGKRVEGWPKEDPPPPAWRCECPRDPQPPNYDPYRIKVPDVMVPPLPPSNARWNGVALTSNPHGGQHYTQGPGSHGTEEPQSSPPVQQQDQAKEEATPEDETFLGYLRGLFGKGKKTERKEGGSDNTMMVAEKYISWECPHCAVGEFYGYPEYQQASIPTERVTDLFYNSPSIRDYWNPQPEKKDIQTKETQSKLGYHGRSKLMYAFHEPWKPLDRMTLLEQAEREESGHVDEEPAKTLEQEQLTK
ncbi:hypothetical protein evm_004155 [Chilo suppressalis]|nr:hypothetical protein evm_004155 [Chilo suppressalis]